MNRTSLVIGVASLFVVAVATHAQETAWLAGEETEFERRVNETLGQQAALDFEQVHLDGFIDYLRDVTKLDIVIDGKALADAGIATDTPVTIRVNHVSYQSALKLVLDEFDLTWLLYCDVVFITTKTEAENLLATKIYDVRDLAYEQPAGAADIQSLVELVTSCVAPTTWDMVGGPGAIKEYRGPRIHALVISQTREIHNEIASLLADMRKLAKRAPLEQAGSHSVGSQSARRASAHRRESRLPRVYAVAPAWSQPQVHE